MRSRKNNNRKECSQLFCDELATRKVKFKKAPMVDLDREIVYFCQEHAQEKKNDDDLKTMWIARI
jgi:hypothetical protein